MSSHSRTNTVSSMRSLLGGTLAPSASGSAAAEAISGLKRVRKDSPKDARAMAEWSSKNWVWVPDQKQGYVAGWVVKEEGESSTVAIESADEMRKVLTTDLTRVNPPAYEGSEDIADLTYLNEASVVHNLRTRYLDSSIYTYSGLFLVAVNPYRPLPIYTPQIIDAYKNKRREENAPHVYAVAEKAWQNMLSHSAQSQSVLVTGESGAGKTENTKKVIQYLAAIAADPMTSSSSFDRLARQHQSEQGSIDRSTGKKLGQLERQILEANPILESFGNAQTVKNNNSSRFGKFVRIFFNSLGAIAGANIDWYLLEKSRVTARSEQERSFHIFFQLLRGADANLKGQLLLEGSPKDYEYLQHSRQDVDGMDDVVEWQNLIRALRTVGFSTEEQMQLFRVMAAILHLGNVSILGEGNNQAHLRDMAQLEKVCFLLGIQDTNAFMNALVRPKVKAGREWVTQARTSKQVVDEIAALSKALYEKSFSAMVDRINQALGRPSTKTFIGVLDIAGFEIFDTNGFEQLCINFTNEKLQQFFNHHMFVLEQEEYSREEIEWAFVNFGLELQPTIDLIESTSPMGILSCLDDACIMPNGSDQSFTAKMHQLATAKPVADQYKKYTPSRFDQGFTVSHYAGAVEYRTQGWLDKNRDPLNDNLTSLLASSGDQYVQKLFAEYAESDAVAEGPKIRIRKGAFRTVGQRHKDQLAILMGQLADTQPHFVRCIVPNMHKAPGIIDAPLVLDQLRCNGVLEGIRIARLGYPNRMPFSDFRRRFEIIAPGVVSKGFVDGAKACESILRHLELDPTTYKLGLTKVFFKAGVLADLEQQRDERLADIFVRIQAACRKFTARRAANKVLNRAAAVRTIQRNARLYVELRAWPWWPLFQRVRPLLAAARSDDAIRKKEEELNAAIEKAAQESRERVRLENLHRELEHTQIELANALASERSASSEKDALLVRSKQREAELEHELDLIRKDLETVDSQLERAMVAKAQAEKQIADVNDAWSKTKALVNTLQQEQTAWKAKEAQLATQKSVKTAEWDALVRESEANALEAAKLKRQLAELDQDRARESSRLNATVSALEQRLKTAQDEAKDSLARLTKTQRDAQSDKDASVILNREKASLESQLKTTASELSRLQTERESTLRERDSWLSRIRSLEVELASQKQEASNARSLIDAARKAEAEAAKQLTAMKKLLDAKMDDHQRQTEVVRLKEGENSSLRSQISRMQNDLSIAQRDAASDAARAKAETDLVRREVADLKQRQAEATRRANTAAARVSELETIVIELERHQQNHDLQLEVVRSEAAESMLREREQYEKAAAAVRAKVQSAEDALLAAQRERDSARDQVNMINRKLEAESQSLAQMAKQRKALEDKVEQQHSVLADLDTINGDLRRELADVKLKPRIAEDRGGKTVIEHIRVLEEAQRLQNEEMARIKADQVKKDAYVRTLERQRQSLNQRLEDLQHERDAEKRDAFSKRPKGDDGSSAKLLQELEAEKKLRQLAELNVARLRNEISQQTAELAKAKEEVVRMKKSSVQLEQELNIIARSDVDAAAPGSPTRRWMQESRYGNGIASPTRSTFGDSPSQKGTGLPRSTTAPLGMMTNSPRRRANYE